MKPRIVVIGIGSEYPHDDAVGLAVVRRLREQGGAALKSVAVLEESGEAAALMEAWKGAEVTVICDAIRSGAEPGTIYQFDIWGQQLPPMHILRCSTHTLGITQAIEMARASGQLPPRLILYGIEGADFQPGTGISPAVEEAVEWVVECIVELLEMEVKVVEMANMEVSKMKTVVIYHSEYGNTKRIAEAVGEALKDYGEAQVLPVSKAKLPDLTGADLLAIGGPTQGHGLSEAMHVFLESIPEGALDGVRAITFDTRFNMPALLTGSAAGQIEKVLKKLGCELVVPHESFFIKGGEGPLAAGELERATEWARTAASKSGLPAAAALRTFVETS